VIRSELVFVVGSLVAGGKYRVDRIIGRGGMGMVIGATHLRLQQPVALKFLLPELAEKPEIVERFIREARASAQLRGEHVCRVSDVETAENGVPYIVMELLQGRDLASLLDARRSLPVPLVADHVLQACVGVAEAHALGIIHRDLKPGNLFLTARPDGVPLIKVLDFGIAKAQRDQLASLTHTSAILGSPSYMSPEQLKSPRNADVRSDIWSIGVILYELTSGHLPFTGETLTALALHISMDPVPPLGGRLPPGFDAVVYRCLEKDPAQRYPDLAELAHALASYAGLAGRDLAGTVSRLLHRTDRTDRTDHTDRAELSAGASTQRAGSAAVVEHERGQVATTLPEVTIDPARRGSPPTTMGSAASSMSTPALVARRRGVIAGVAGVAGAAILAVVVAIAVAGIGKTMPTSTGGGREPGSAAGGGTGTDSSPATPSAPDAAVVVATQPPLDAAAPLAVDAGAAQTSIDAASGAAGEPSAADHPPSRGSKKNPPKRDKHLTSEEEQDYGATRH
jgi:serine/threonine-protein kinase